MSTAQPLLKLSFTEASNWFVAWVILQETALILDDVPREVTVS